MRWLTLRCFHDSWEAGSKAWRDVPGRSLGGAFATLDRRWELVGDAWCHCRSWEVGIVCSTSWHSNRENTRSFSRVLGVSRTK